MDTTEAQKALNDIDALPSGFGNGGDRVGAHWLGTKDGNSRTFIYWRIPVRAGFGSAIESLKHGHVLVVLLFALTKD